MTAGVNAKRQHRHFASTEGSLQHQHLIEAGGGLIAIAADGDEVQRRSYPNSFHGDTGGDGLGIRPRPRPGRERRRVGDEAGALLAAPMAPPGISDLVIGARQVSLRSTSPAATLSSSTGFSATSGTSRAPRSSPRRRRKLSYGSPAVTITSDPTVRGPAATSARRRRHAGPPRGPDPGRSSSIRSPPVTPPPARDWPSPAPPLRRLGVSAGLLLHPRPRGAGLGPLDGADRPARARLLHGGQSQLVHRQPSAELPVRHRGRLRREERSPGRLLRNFSYGGITVLGPVRPSPGRRVPRLRISVRKGLAETWGFLSHGAAPMLARAIRTGVA